MSKKSTATTPAPQIIHAPVIPMGTVGELTNWDQQIAILQAKVAEANHAIQEAIARKQAEANAQLEHKKAKFMEIPAMFGVSTFEEVISLHNELFAQPTAVRVGRTKVDEVKRAQIVKSLREHMTAAECAKTYNLSIATINVIKKGANLVKSRTLAAVASV